MRQKAGGPGATIFIVFAIIAAVGISATWYVASLLGPVLELIPNSGVEAAPDPSRIIVTEGAPFQAALATGGAYVILIVWQLLRQVLDRALGRRDTGPVQFRPPQGVRPAHLGLLFDGEVDEADLVGSIVDLAARGHLRIETVDGDRFVLIRETGRDGLLPFEVVLLDRLFMTAGSQYIGSGGSKRVAVELGALRGRFATGFEDVRETLLQEAVARGWFRRHPDDARWFWWAIGITGIVGGIVAGLYLATAGDWAVVTLPVIGGSVLLLVFYRWFPVRARRGRQLLRESAGFRRFVATAEAGRAEFADEEGEVVAYLGYAVAMRLVSGWADRFRGIEGPGRARRLDATPLEDLLEVARLAEAGQPAGASAR